MFFFSFHALSLSICCMIQATCTLKHTLVAPVASIPIFLIVLSWHNEINEYRIGNAVEKNVSKKKWYRSIWTKYNITQTVVDACWFECFPSYCRLLFEVSSHLFSLSPFGFCFLSTHFPFSFVCVRNILNILQSRFESKAKKKGLKQSPLELLWRTAKYDERGSKSRQIWLKESAGTQKNP